MTGTLGLFLVLASAALHAYWNFELKRAGGGHAVLALSKGVEAVVLLPALAFFLFQGNVNPGDLGYYAAIGAVLVLANYVLLAAAYARADLSLVYPVSRGCVLLFLPILGWVVLREPVTWGGGAGLALITGGVLMQAPGGNAVLGAAQRSRVPLVLAMGAAAVAAVYTLWDKSAVLRLPPVAYFAAYTGLTAAAYLGWARRSLGPAELNRAWSSHRRSVVAIAAGNTVSYVLVLFALRQETSSNVIALRQLSIVFGFLLGWKLLREPATGVRLWGIVALVVGCVLVAALGAPR